MSDQESPELQALRQLEQLVRGLGDELATFRRRALQAESKLKQLESGPSPGEPFTPEQGAKLERENIELRARLVFATERTRGVLQQVRFLRQQASQPVGNNSGSGGAGTAGGGGGIP